MDDALHRYLAAGEQAGARYSFGTPRLAPVAAAGGTLGQRAGSSLEFRDYRDYQPGDDLRHLDWAAYARNDHLTLKLYREEVTPHVDILVDMSRSMALEGSAKAEATLGLAALFAAAADNAGFAHVAWAMADKIEPVANGKKRPTEWQDLAFVHRGVPGVPPRLRPRSIRVLVSDLLWPAEPLQLLRPLAEGAATVIVVQLLAAADADPPENESLRLVDAETGQMREVFVDAPSVARYRDALARHQQHWHAACRQLGALFSVLIAERLIADWRLDELVAAEVLRIL